MDTGLTGKYEHRTSTEQQMKNPPISETFSGEPMTEESTEKNWLELPPEVTANILQRLGAVEILETAQKVCTTWHKICKDPSMWRLIDMRNSGELDKITVDLEKMCMRAVDRSEGQLMDINIEYFGTTKLLGYIVERSSKLRRLKISCCYGCVYDGLNAAVNKLPLLEELHLNHTYISKEAIADLGRFCPHLKSFKFNIQWSVYSDFEFEESGMDVFESNNDAVFAIAENMSNLHQLQIIGNQITDKGLLAILEKCTRLESLDLRRCLNLKLEGSLGKRCLEQIKDFKGPNDSLQDCEFVFEVKSDSGYFSEFSADGDDDDMLLAMEYDDMLSFDDDDDDDDDEDDDDDDDDDGSYYDYL